MTTTPLAGRRFYFVGIGGAGLSAYANFARGWGAQVKGWDKQETIYMETLSGVDVDIGGDPSPPPGFEVVLSAAHAGRAEGRSRAEVRKLSTVDVLEILQADIRPTRMRCVTLPLTVLGAALDGNRP